jgi:DNA-binding response OmpR family regulator
MGSGSLLVVDDDPAILATVADVLEFAGYAVATATNGREALSHLDALPAHDPRFPALVLLDLRMPVLDGWAFAAAVRERGVILPIVAMTAARDAAAWAAQIGAAACLPKPFEIADVLGTVEALLREGPGADLLALKNDLAVALLALEALSADTALGEEQRRLVDVGLARLLRAVERLGISMHAEGLDDPH